MRFCPNADKPLTSSQVYGPQYPTCAAGGLPDPGRSDPRTGWTTSFAVLMFLVPAGTLNYLPGSIPRIVGPSPARGLRADESSVSPHVPAAGLGCAGRLDAVRALVADQSGLPQTIETRPDALKVAVNDSMVVGSVATHA